MEPPRLSLRSVRATPVDVPMARPLGTSVQTIRTAPLLLIDLETEEGITGRSYLFCYFKAAAAPIMRMLEDALESVTPDTAKLVLTLNRLGTDREDPVVASMYRHLAHWPPYLALAWTLVAPLETDGRLYRATEEVLDYARRRAGRMIVEPSPSFRAPAAEIHAAARDSLEHFTGKVILKMVLIGALLRNATDGEPRNASRGGRPCH